MELESFGYWVRRRRKALDLTQSALAHHVGCATVTVKKIERDERRPSRTMAERLAECLAVPENERSLFIQCALGENSFETLPLSTRPKAWVHPEPAQPAARTSRPGVRDLFVGREGELARLDGQLQSMLAGEGQVAFIVGGAGRGKTALMMEFIQRAVDTHPDLVASGGLCSAYAGIGDPYLPFREVLGYLTGSTESHWLANLNSAAQEQRIWQALPQTLQVLLEDAPYLIEDLIPGTDLLRRAASIAPDGASWLEHLRSEVAQRRKAASVPEQSTIFGQFSNLLLHLSRRHPLLIALDDLHWADEASVGLFFHLTRHIRSSRVMILAAYRPEELASGSTGRRSLLEKALGEVKRTYGDISLDLAAADRSTGSHFVDAYLNAQPNRFSSTFHRALYRHTGGHPLFTVEFVREMQARGDLVLAESGQWQVAENLDWSALPSRVEAVIAQRFSHLDPELIEILNIACVEGEQFNAEVIAQISGIPLRKLLAQISGLLVKQHQLVQARGEVKLSNRLLSPYSFRHALFQQYLYDQLDPGERRRLHGEVAEALEILYKDELETIAAQLAWHYQEGRQAHKAVKFLEIAGKRAIRLSGYEEAVHLLQDGLSLYETLPLGDQEVDMKLEMLLALGEAFYRSGHNDESLETYQTAVSLARLYRLPHALARAALGYEESRWRFNYPSAPSRLLLEEALGLLGDEDLVLRTRLTIGQVRTLKSEISPAQFSNLSGQVIEMARSLGDPMILYDALYLIPWGNRQPQDSAKRLGVVLEMRRLAESIGDIARQQEALNNHALELLELGDLQAVVKEFSTQEKLIEKAHFLLYYYLDQLSRASLAIMMGDFSAGESLAFKALQINHQINHENADGIFGIQMFTIRREQDRLKELLPLVKLFVEQHQLSETWRPGLALIYSELDMRPEARTLFEDLAAQDFAEIPDDAFWLTCIAYLAEVCAYLGDVNRAGRLYQLMLPYAGRVLVTGYFGACYGAVDRYLGLLEATQSRWDQAVWHFREAIRINERMEAWPWLAHTQFAYAEMLLNRAQNGDLEQAGKLLQTALETACSLGMNSLVEKVTKIIGEEPCLST